MDLETAIAVVFREVERRGQNRVAKALGVKSSTITKWKGGARPEGANKEAVIEMAERLGAPSTVTPDVLMAAVAVTGESLARLAEIRTYARVVLEQLQDAAKRQEMVVSALEPWSDAEGRHAAARLLQQLTDTPETAKTRAELDVASASEPVVTPPAETPPAVPARRRATGRG